MHKPILLLLTLLDLMACKSFAQGTVEWGWHFERSRYVVSQTEPVVLNATVYVRPNSALPLTTASIGGFFSSALFRHYQYDCGFCSDPGFVDFRLGPGESYSFHFATFTPNETRGGVEHVPVGTYRADSLVLIFENGNRQRAADSPLIVEVVPEPSVTEVLAIGGLLFAFRKRRRD